MFKTKNQETALETNQSIGQTLRAAREAQGLSWAEISRDCKLQERFLEALESGHTCQLPSHIYFRMFARTYAESLKLDTDQLLGRLYPELPEPEFAPIRNPQDHAVPLDADERHLAKVLSDDSIEQADTPTVQQPTLAAQAAVNPYPVSPAAYGQVSGWRPYSGAPGGSKTGMNIGVLLSANRAIVSRLALGVLGATLLFIIGKYVVVNYGIASQEPSPLAPTETVTETALEQAGIPTYHPRGMLELTIRARDKTAVLVIADGDTLFNRELREGEALTWKSNYRFKIDVANKNNVEMFIGGQKLREPDGAGKTLSHFEINQLNYQELLRDDRQSGVAPSGGN